MRSAKDGAPERLRYGTIQKVVQFPLFYGVVGQNGEAIFPGVRLSGTTIIWN